MKKNFHVLSMLFVLFQALLQVNLYAMRDAEDDQPETESTQASRTPEGQKRTFDSVSSTRTVASHRNVGLKNGGRNICYINAVVQCLSNLKVFRSTLLGNKAFYQQERIDDTPENRAKKILVLNLIKLFENLRTTSASEVKDKDFTERAKKLIEDIPANKGKSIQDADEFLTLLLSQIHEPDKISLELKLNQKVKCLATDGISVCPFESQKHETYETIALPLDKIERHNTLTELQELLTDFFHPSLANGYQCGSCNKVNTSFKSSEILEDHDILIMSLKRFTADGRKIINPVSFTMELDLKPYAADELKNREGVNLLYELAGFVCHGCNHYISIVKDFENGKWYVYNDSSVSEINEQVIQGIVKAGSFPLSFQNFTPYILFYQKKRPTAQAPAQPAAQQSGARPEARGFNPNDDDADLSEPSSQKRKEVVDLQDPEAAASMAGTLPSIQQLQEQEYKSFFRKFYDWITHSSQKEEALRNQEEARLREEAIKKRQEELRIQAEALEKRQNVGLMQVSIVPYLNSVVQCLSNLKNFKTQLVSSENNYEDNFFVFSLINLIKKLKTSSEPVTDQNLVEQAKILIEQSKNHEVAFQVADEFLNLLLGQLHAQDKQPLNLSINIITQCLKRKDILGCEYTSDKGGVVQPKTTICPNQLKSVQEILEAHFAPFFDKSYACQRCHQAGTSAMVQRILGCPFILRIKRI
ncbi:MAG: hypothetical protein WCS92_01275 [Candidatus Babeliales bacterium]